MTQVQKKIFLTLVLGCLSATALPQDGYGVGGGGSSDSGGGGGGAPAPTPGGGGGSTPINPGNNMITEFIDQSIKAITAKKGATAGADLKTFLQNVQARAREGRKRKILSRSCPNTLSEKATPFRRVSDLGKKQEQLIGCLSTPGNGNLTYKTLEEIGNNTSLCPYIAAMKEENFKASKTGTTWNISQDMARAKAENVINACVTDVDRWN